MTGDTPRVIRSTRYKDWRTKVQCWEGDLCFFKIFYSKFFLINMTHIELAKEIAHLVERACAAPTNVFGYGIWTHHIQEVVRLGKELSAEFGADEEVVELAALLHDYASVKDERLYAKHHLHGPLEAETLLTSLDYPAEKITAVKRCIAEHRGSVTGERTTPEARCLATADALAHIQNVPSLLYFAYVHQKLSVDEGATWVREKLTRSWRKVDARVQERSRGAYEAALLSLYKG